MRWLLSHVEGCVEEGRVLARAHVNWSKYHNLSRAFRPFLVSFSEKTTHRPPRKNCGSHHPKSIQRVSVLQTL